MSDILLYPTLKRSSFKQIPATSESSTLRLYKLSTGARDPIMNTEPSPQFAVLVTSTIADSTRTSKFYLGRFCIDFQLDAVQDYILFRDMYRLSYLSSLVKSSEKDLLRQMDLEGGPDRWDLIKEDLELWPARCDGRRELHSSCF